MSVDNEINVEIQDNDIILEEIKKIEELDVSINHLEIQMKVENEELSKFQSKNREKLKELLLFAPKEYGILSKNTNSFLDLCRSEEIDDLEDQGDDINDSGEASNITDEDKERLENLINEQDFDVKSDSNPYFITEDLKYALEENAEEKFN